MAVLSLFHPGVKQKENECAGAYDCSFANGSRCGLIAPNDRMNRSNETRFYGDREMTKLRTAVTAAAMAALLTGTQAMAADGPLLAPGKPGGVQEAQRGTSHLLLIGGAALVAVVGIAIAVANSDDAQCGSACTAPTTTS
jgi:hypothetical protein